MNVLKCLALAGILGGIAAPVLAGGPPALTTVRVASSLVRPNYVTHAPGDFERIFIIEKRGVIKVMNLQTQAITTFMDISSSIAGGTTTNSEQGLLGLAFHPDYANNGYFYVNYTASGSGATRISRFTVSANPNVGNPASELVLMTIAQPFTNHNGGWMDFSPIDGYLYISTGDGGSGNDPGNRAQTRSNLLGKILRIDVDGNNGPGGVYGIPASNPYVGNSSGFREEIWSFGLRNAWRCSFDRLTGDLYMGDVGQDAREEVNFQFVTSAGGENYGWRCREGNIPTPGISCTPVTPWTDPVHWYIHTSVPFICAVTGGYVYRGCAIPGLEGTYFFAEYCSNQIWTFKVNGTGTGITDFQERTSELTPNISTLVNIVSLGEDAYGELYFVKQGSGSNGEIFKLVAANGPFEDCNSNGIEDACEILDGSAEDANSNNIPDECEPDPTCAGDADGSGEVNIDDLTFIVLRLGNTGDPCIDGDVDGNGTVDIDDITYTVLRLGACNPGGPC